MTIFVISIIFNLFSKLKRGTIVGIKKELKKNRYKNSKNYSNYSKDFRTILFRLIEEG